jgi:hypothetical protein
MSAPTLTTLIPILQLAIGPVILISGVGLLLLSLTNRFGRLVDRSRLLAKELREHPEASIAGGWRQQIAILHRRAGLLRMSILLAAAAVLLVAVLILVLFLSALLGLAAGGVVIAIFCLSLLCLIGSVGAFIRDMNLSLDAFRLEIGQ